MLRQQGNLTIHRCETLSQRFIVFRGNSIAQKVYARRISANGGSSGKENDDINDLFKQELDKRQIRSIDDLSNDDSQANPDGPGETGVAVRQARQGQNSNPPPPFANVEDQVPPQLRKSRELNSEGLEGLIPRATELIKLGTSVFLAFGPLILAVTIAFAAIYFVFGDAFVHPGQPSTTPPPLYDPDQLLNEPTVDPMIPM